MFAFTVRQQRESVPLLLPFPFPLRWPHAVSWLGIRVRYARRWMLEVVPDPVEKSILQESNFRQIYRLAQQLPFRTLHTLPRDRSPLIWE